MLPNYLSAAKELYGMDWRKVKLQEDGASAHKAKACGAWMKDNWPGGVLLTGGPYKTGQFCFCCLIGF